MDDTLRRLYADFAAVLETAAHGAAVLSLPLVPRSSELYDVNTILSVPGELSVRAKLASGSYDLPKAAALDAAPAPPALRGPMLLFHDLRLAFARLVSEYDQSSPEYAAISALYRFACDLLVREANRLNLAQLSTDGDRDAYLARIAAGFQVISAEIQEPNSETFYVTAANGPLFMSASNKAPVDPRDTAVAGSVHTVKLLPHIARAPESTLGFTSPLNPRFPQPNAPPTEILSHFVHPNSHTTVPPLWLASADAFGSFAPTTDSAGAVVPAEDAAALWAERRPRGAAAPKPEPEQEQDHDVELADAGTPAALGALSNASSAAVSSRASPLTVRSASPSDGHEFDPVPLPQLASYGAFAGGLPLPPACLAEAQDGLSAADLELLLRWSPYSFVDDDELEAAQQGSEHALVSRLLLELQYMQRERLAAPGVELEVGDSERHVALKAANVLARLVAHADPEDIRLQLDTRLPVIMRNYAGSLPAATDPAMRAPQQPFPQQRLQSLQGLRQQSIRRPVRR